MTEDHEPKAVMVYIFGGAFKSGTKDTYKPDFLIENDVVLVIFNYRMSILGKKHITLYKQNIVQNSLFRRFFEFGPSRSTRQCRHERPGISITLGEGQH